MPETFPYQYRNLIMKILVPTDFSECAKHALNAACQIGQVYGAEIHLYHSAPLPEEWEDLPIMEKLNDEVNRSLAIMVKSKLLKAKEDVDRFGLKFKFHYTGGKFLKNIEEILEEVDIDLIVMGSKGVSGKQEWFIGSNAQKVVRKIHKNTLIVKNSLPNVDFNKVLFASNLSLKDKVSFRRFLEFIKPFNVKELHILSVDTFGFFSQPSILMLEALKDFKALVKDIECKTHFISDYSVESGIRNFTRNNGIDLIGIAHNTRNPIKRIFQGSNVEMLINHADVPVLCVDE